MAAFGVQGSVDYSLYRHVTVPQVLVPYLSPIFYDKWHLQILDLLGVIKGKISLILLGVPSIGTCVTLCLLVQLLVFLWYLFSKNLL